MNYQARIAIPLKPGISDPEGDALYKVLVDGGYSKVKKVKSGKYWEIYIKAENKKKAMSYLMNSLRKDPLLGNIVKDDFILLSLEEVK